MSMPNNISASTGTNMKGEQHQLLRYAKRECYEGANIPGILELRSLLPLQLKQELFDRLEILSPKIQAYSDSLK